MSVVTKDMGQVQFSCVINRYTFITLDIGSCMTFDGTTLCVDGTGVVL
jgi:hypothetical protein